MTYAPLHSDALREPHGRKVADSLAFIADAINAFRVWRLNRRTERLIASLPADICKDIGWPSAAADDRRSPRGRLARM
ncbi:hypothetical protein J5J10_07400 [Ciceribacter sp. L1K23]|uniref:hypothetical protein n=1 Tax=unclassified Ciceribacter TaxID=2628820 RepID=UPI001ABDC2BA|nr:MULTISPECIES: hypothetical protein [unclassified Ciceribacter]MBO3760440.1 hypothetical protein [Ciceribacter sp. L1K22]MBR0555504.1 hypothetical protein [Ciceribacter sp. L1K23]